MVELLLADNKSNFINVMFIVKTLLKQSSKDVIHFAQILEVMIFRECKFSALLSPASL